MLFFKSSLIFGFYEPQTSVPSRQSKLQTREKSGSRRRERQEELIELGNGTGDAIVLCHHQYCLVLTYTGTTLVCP